MSETTASWGLAEGEEIAPGLHALRLLGGGSAYEAYLGFDELLYAPVVVKVVRPDQVDDEATMRGLERECEMLARLSHPAIVRAFRATLSGPRPYVVLENLDGPRLSSLIRRHGALPPQQLLPLGIELCSAAHYLRQMDVVHLDIKPSNIIMGAPARLIDLSVARSSERAARLTTAIGSDAYMAPEQCVPTPERQPSYASDMWGIGTTLYHALAGYRAFDRGVKDPSAAPEARWPQLVDDPYQMPENISPDLAKPVLSCLHRDPGLRPTPAELAEAFEPLMAALPKPRLAGFKISARF